MDSTIITVALMSASFICGYITRVIQEKIDTSRFVNAKNSAQALEDIVSFVIIISWFVSVIVQIVSPVREVPLAIHILMGSVVGYLYKKENPILQGIVKNITGKRDVPEN